MERSTSGGTRRSALDADRFDQLAVSVSQAAPSRRSLLRRMAGGGLATAIAALGGVSLLAKPGAAKKSGKKTRRRAICHRTSATDPGVTKKMKAKKAKKELKQHQFDTKGKCQATGGTSGTGGTGGGTTFVTNNFLPAGAAGQVVPPTGTPDAPNTCVLGTAQGCPGNFTCILNAEGLQVCLPNNLLPTITCTSDAQCGSGFCANLAGLRICVPCGTLGTVICGPGGRQVCCAVNLCVEQLGLEVCALPAGGGLIDVLGLDL
jgi:hypothetical protein